MRMGGVCRCESVERAESSSRNTTSCRVDGMELNPCNKHGGRSGHEPSPLRGDESSTLASCDDHESGSYASHRGSMGPTKVSPKGVGEPKSPECGSAPTSMGVAKVPPKGDDEPKSPERGSSPNPLGHHGQKRNSSRGHGEKPPGANGMKKARQRKTDVAGRKPWTGCMEQVRSTGTPSQMARGVIPV